MCVLDHSMTKPWYVTKSTLRKSLASALWVIRWSWKVLYLVVSIHNFFQIAAAAVLEIPSKVLTRLGRTCSWHRRWYEVVFREAYRRHVCIFRTLWVLLHFPRSERRARLPVDFIACPAAHLRSYSIPSFISRIGFQEVQTLIHFLRTSCRSRGDAELECNDDVSKTDLLGETIYLLSRQRDQNMNHVSTHRALLLLKWLEAVHERVARLLNPCDTEERKNWFMIALNSAAERNCCKSKDPLIGVLGEFLRA